MFKVTEDGVKQEGTVRELSREDLEFIKEMFEDLSEHERPHLFEEDTYGDILDS